MIAARENIPYDRYLSPSSTYWSAGVNGECSRMTIPNGRVSIIALLKMGADARPGRCVWNLGMVEGNSCHYHPGNPQCRIDMGSVGALVVAIVSNYRKVVDARRPNADETIADNPPAKE